MADKKITELTPITGANLADADEFVVVDVSADETKSVTRAEFFKNIPHITGTITSDGLTINTPDEDHLRLENGSELGFVRLLDSGALDFWAHGDNSTDIVTFRTGSGTGSERMRIDASGNVLVGTTSLAVFSDTNDGVLVEPAGAVVASRNSNTVGFFRRRGTDGGVFTFLKDTTAVGSISVTDYVTAYNTSSDYRLKEDWVPMSGASERVQALKPVNFAWKVDASRVDGFLAHELAEVIPEAVTGTKDAMRDEEYEVTPAVLDEDGNETSPAVMATRSVPDMQGIDQSKIVPLLTAALQEALTKIADLETRLAPLEA